MFDSIPKFCVVLQNVRNLLQRANNDIVSDERLGMNYVSAAYMSLCLFFPVTLCSVFLDMVLMTVPGLH